MCFGTEPEDSTARGLLCNYQRSDSQEVIVLVQPSKDFQYTVLKVNWLGSCLKNSSDLGTSCKFCARASKLHLGMKTLIRNGRWAFAMMVNLRGKNQSQKWIPWFMLVMLTVLPSIHEGILYRPAPMLCFSQHQ